MHKKDFIAIFVIIISAILIIAGCYKQIYEQKLKLLCRGKLNNIGSAFFTYRQTPKYQHQNLQDWNKSLRPYSADKDFGFCPKQGENAPGYQVHLLQVKDKMQIQPPRILFFESNETTPYKQTISESDFSARHLQGANFLMTNGAVIYKKKYDFKIK